MIINRGNNSKLYRLQNIYDMLNQITKTKKTERLNSAMNSSNKPKFHSYHSFHKNKIKKIRVINRNLITKSNEKLISDQALDIVNRDNLNEKMKQNITFKTSSVNTFKDKETNKIKHNVQIQTDGVDKLNSNKSLNLSKEYQYSNACRSIMEYRMKKYRQKKRINLDENKNNSPVFKTVKNINFPNIYSQNNSNANFDFIINQSSKRKFNIKKYYKALTNLRIKLHGNILITRKSKEFEINNTFKKKIEIKKNDKTDFQRNSSLNITIISRYRNLSKREQICNFSNKMIRESLSDVHMKKTLANIKK